MLVNLAWPITAKVVPAKTVVSTLETHVVDTNAADKGKAARSSQGQLNSSTDTSLRRLANAANLVPFPDLPVVRREILMQAKKVCLLLKFWTDA